MRSKLPLPPPGPKLPPPKPPILPGWTGFICASINACIALALDIASLERLASAADPLPKEVLDGLPAACKGCKETGLGLLRGPEAPTLRAAVFIPPPHIPTPNLLPPREVKPAEESGLILVAARRKAARVAGAAARL